MESSSGRSIDIEVGSQEIITIDLDNLDPNPDDVVELLKDGQCKPVVWTKLAAEYWRRGYLDAAEKIATTCRDENISAPLGPIYILLANIQMARGRQAPKLVLTTAQEDVLKEQRTKDEFHKAAAGFLNSASQHALQDDTVSFLTRGIQQMATRSLDDAMRTFDGVLVEKPTNLVALLGKARILYARRNYQQALQTFQTVLRYNPDCQPDPRIGIGLCLWAMDHKDKAKAAWQRSLELNPSAWAAQLLLGLEAINSSKNEQHSETDRAHSFLTGTKFVEKAFNGNQKSASAANALSELFLLKKQLQTPERTIQFADTIPVLTEGYVRAGRAAHAEGSLSQATRHYTSAIEDEMAAAIHTLDTLMQPPNPQQSLEAHVMLASLRAHPRPGVSSSDIAQERTRARDLYDRVSKTMDLEDARMNGHGPSKLSRTIGEDLDMHIEIGRLWQAENLDRTARALKEALRISEVSWKVLYHLEDSLVEARAFYENALTTAAGMGSEGLSMSTTMLYNLARVYEDQGESVLAKDAYDKLLSRHPEYIDAKIRQAQLLTNLNRGNDAHDLLKQSLTSQNTNLNLRAFYTYFLIECNLLKPARDFVFTTLKDHDKHDVYSLCAAGWIHYNTARESRDTSTRGTEERRKNFQRSAEFYEKALQLDPLCAVAAQGLAIVTAEDALGVMSGISQPGTSADEAHRRLKFCREALDVFAKVRESINDGSVYLNMGHCYYARDEFDRAIESYETASTRFYDGHNVGVLICLCRSWYAKGLKDQSYAAMNTAVRYAQQALHVQPNDKAVVYNIAMIQQKSAEMLFLLPPAKRTLKDLQNVIERAGHAQNTSTVVPYSRDIADQRRKYGDNMLKKGDEHLTVQRQHESEAKAKLDSARQKRQEDKERVEALERARMEELRKDAERLAEERRVRIDSDDEKERKTRKPRKNKAEAGGGSGDEAEPKKKRRGKLKKSGDAEGNGEGEEAATFTDDDDGERPTKKVCALSKAQYHIAERKERNWPRRECKSKEMLSDTDDEMS
ncbi:RNA polymerase II-associated protein [Mycena floridula]|nr:RNA polymerase II-associated protein [Mycena floridula]